MCYGLSGPNFTGRGPAFPVTATQLIDIVFPGATNHHGTLFGGVGLAHMDKVAFIAATRHAHVDFVTASCERIDFQAPAHPGDLVEVTGTVTRAGRRSLGVAVEMVAEAPLSGERRLCTRGVFNMVAVGPAVEADGWRMPPLATAAAPPDGCRMVEMVMPEQTSHYGSLYGGHTLGAMAKAAFILATRRTRRTLVMASVQRVDFTAQVESGAIIELVPTIAATGRRSLTVDVALHAESLRSGERRLFGSGTFVMVAVAEAESVPTG